MKKLLLCTLLGLSVSNAYADGDSQEVFKMDAQTAIKAFATELKATLVGTMKTEGPVAAIAVCKDEAPKIAEKLSQKYALNIGRTSLKYRNPNNQPDAWELGVLQSFETRLAGGEPAKTISFMEEVSSDAGTQWRLMKAIPTGEVCLTCHGEKLAEPVQAQLNKLYPEDNATGFKAGDIRGAFTVSQPL